MKENIKDYMMIIGSKIISNDIMEITMVPLDTVKNKPKNIMDIALSGDISSLIGDITGMQKHESKHFITLRKWADMGLKIGSHITMSINEGEK